MNTVILGLAFFCAFVAVVYAIRASGYAEDARQHARAAGECERRVHEAVGDTAPLEVDRGSVHINVVDIDEARERAAMQRYIAGRDL